MIPTNLPWHAIFLSTLANMILGYFWYSPLVLGKSQKKFEEIKKESFSFQEKSLLKIDAKEKNPAGFVYLFLGSFLSAYILAGILNVLKIDNLSSALQIGFWAWFLFIGLGNFLSFALGKKSARVCITNAGYSFASFLVIILVLANFK